MQQFSKGRRVRYVSGSGFLYSAIVLRAHRDGDCTIRVYFPLRDGEEMTGCFQGDVFRVSRIQVEDMP